MEREMSLGAMLSQLARVQRFTVFFEEDEDENGDEKDENEKIELEGHHVAYDGWALFVRRQFVGHYSTDQQVRDALSALFLSPPPPPPDAAGSLRLRAHVAAPARRGQEAEGERASCARM
jgi:hypothetical protein